MIHMLADAYSRRPDGLNYQSIGSGGASSRSSPRQSTSARRMRRSSSSSSEKDGLVQFPMVMGGVVPVVNIDGIAPGQMKLTGKLLADIYLGKISKWNDPQIAGANQGLKLPDQRSR